MGGRQEERDCRTWTEEERTNKKKNETKRRNVKQKGKNNKTKKKRGNKTKPGRECGPQTTEKMPREESKQVCDWGGGYAWLSSQASWCWCHDSAIATCHFSRRPDVGKCKGIPQARCFWHMFRDRRGGAVDATERGGGGRKKSGLVGMGRAADGWTCLSFDRMAYLPTPQCVSSVGWVERNRRTAVADVCDLASE
jgi:hypothetical protein